MNSLTSLKKAALEQIGKLILPLVLVLLVALMLPPYIKSVSSSLFEFVFPEQPTASVEITSILINGLKDMAELHTATLETKTTVTTSQKRMVSRWSVGDTNLVYEGVGKVQAAIDMKKLEAKEVDMDNHKIHILLPPPHIVDISLDVKNSQVIASYRRRFGPSVEAELQTEAQQKALKAINAEACANNLLDIANNNAKQIVEEVLRTSGFEKIIVETQNPKSGTCLST